ncbi:hypothetical protein [Paractinoplanes toevensis]|uniref:Uncharacterized protein n=1 Tax=Paractinoplanes toevensis TaxID=571911 RepID=A0A919T5M8_9ACTN|nr:hypothetical protein [Actinoplanes toevensis]GIM88812.1 hypothetical protein Ato02nite_006050 [Actinoplanes toevensis]
MNVVEHLREWSASSGEWVEICDLQRQFDPDDADRFAVGARMADLLETLADRMGRSGLVRAFASSTPESLRAEAAEYRAGRDPRA